MTIYVIYYIYESNSEVSIQYTIYTQMALAVIYKQDWPLYQCYKNIIKYLKSN